MSKMPPDKGRISDVLERVADLLEQQGANPFRVRSYRRAADAVRSAEMPLAGRLEEGDLGALQEIPGIGERLAGAIQEIVQTGRLGLVDTLEAEVSPEAVLARVPGIGETLAARIHEQLGIASLEELEEAAHDGRLDTVAGLGAERVQGIRDALAGMLARSSRRRLRQRLRSTGRDSGASPEPPVNLILDIDAEYRDQAAAGRLRTIAPRRFNPEGESWLPIMEAARDGWQFTALHSNTARAHELGKTRDWVVVYYKRESGPEGQCTVITAGAGPLAGHRIVAGRERESREQGRWGSSIGSGGRLRRRGGGGRVAGSLLALRSAVQARVAHDAEAALVGVAAGHRRER
jgi:DNA polymerase (family 10)